MTNRQLITIPENENKPWGLFATLGFSLVIFLVFVIVQTLAAIAYTYVQIQEIADAIFTEKLVTLSTEGLGIAVSLIPATLAGSLCVFLFAYLKEGLTVKHYLKLNPPAIKQVLFWLATMVLFAIGMEIITTIIGRPLPEWMINSYETAGILPLFWFTLVIAAPVFEELLFRGFLLEGLQQSRIGMVGAIIITSAVWAAIHLQYETFEVISIFVVGLILGYAKIKTNSLYTPIIMHGFMNFLATLQVAEIISQP